MDGNEINYNEVFGIDTTDAGTDGIDGEGIGTENPDTGGNGQSNAGSDVMDAEGNENAGSVSGDNDGEQNGEKSVQSKEERAKYAKARREAERDRDEKVAAARAEAEKAKSDAEKYITDSIARLGIVDPESGTTITTREQLEAYKKRIDEDSRRNFKEKAGMSDDEYNTFIDNLPEVRKAKETVAEADRVRREAELARAKENVKSEISEISSVNPDIKSLDDLVKLPNYGDIYEKVKKGYSLSDAYFSVNRKEITAKQAASAKQSALNSAFSKVHLESSAPRGTGGVSVPTDVAQMYRELNPGISNEEIQKHYAEYLKNKK